MSLVELSHITKAYGEAPAVTMALRGVDLRIESGEFVSIMGASGSGKSTLMHIIGLLDRATQGKYLLDGKRPGELLDAELARLRNSMIGFVFQAFHLLPRVSVLENVMLPMQYSVLPPGEWRGRAAATLARVGMSHRLTHVPSQLSGGEKQRVAIARALVLNPKIILADEPTGNLDSKNGAAVLDLISELHDQGNTVVLVTHEEEAARHAGRIVTLKDGQIYSEEKV